jgi:predicted esterase
MKTQTALHQGQPVLAAGTPLDKANGAMVMVHGRGARAEDILPLAEHFDVPEFAYLAPQAALNTWYPERFIAARSANEPYLSSGLQAIGDAIARINEAGINTEKIMPSAFRRAVFSWEFAARYPQRYGGVFALSGGPIGADDELTGYEGSLDGASVFLGCRRGFHVPLQRVHRSAEIMAELDECGKAHLPGYGTYDQHG